MPLPLRNRLNNLLIVSSNLTQLTVKVLNSDFDQYLQTMLMLGKEEVATQCRFLAEIHQLVGDRVKDNRDIDFTESYLQLIAQLVKNNVDLVNSAGIRLEGILQFCKDYLYQKSSTFLAVTGLKITRILYNFSAIGALTCMESAVLKAAIFLVTTVLPKASELRPSMIDYFKANGLALVRQVVLAIGKQ